MTISGKENMLRFYRHEMPEFLPTTDNGLFVFFNPATYHERPPFVQTGVDWWGVHWKREDSIDAIAPDHTHAPLLDDISEWRDKVVFPDLEAWPWDKVEEIDHVSEIDRENKVFNIMFVNGPFERLHMLMGFENALMALLTDPEEVTAFLDAFMEWKLRLMEKVHQYYKPDVLMFHDDYGTQKDMFFSPETWRTLFKPQLKKAVDKCHELGMFFEMHSCGMIERIVPEFVDIGIDSWQCMEINDIPKLKKLTNGKLSFLSTPNYQKYHAAFLAGELTEEELRKDVRENLIKNAEGGNYCPFPLPNFTGDEYYEIMLDEIEKTGKEIYQK